MKYFAAFSILAVLAGFVGWGAYLVVRAGMMGAALFSIAVALGSLAVVAASIWAVFTALDCLGNIR